MLVDDFNSAKSDTAWDCDAGPQFGAAIRSKVNFTECASKGSPLVNLTPFLK